MSAATVTDHMPRHDELAERALIGHTLNLCRVPEGVNGLAPADFYRPDNATIWAAIRSLADQQKPVDHTSVRAYLQQQGTLDTRGGVPSQSLVELTGTPPVADPGYIAEIIRKNSQRRQWINLHEGGLQRAHDVGVDPEELQRHTEEALGRIRGNEHGDHAKPSAATLERFPRLDLGLLLREDRPEREMVVYGLILAGTSVALVAPAGNKKSCSCRPSASP